MGWFGRSLGSFGSELGEAKDIRQRWQDQLLNLKMKQAQFAQEQMMNPLRLQQVRNELANFNKPIPQGIHPLPGGGEGGFTYDPRSEKYSSQTLIQPAMTPQAVKQQITQSIPSLSDNDKQYANSLMAGLDMGQDPSKVWEEWLRFDSSAAKAQKQKPPVVDVNKGTVAIYDAFGNGTEYPIYDAQGKINPNLPKDVQPLVISQLSAFQKKLDEQNSAADVQADRSDTRQQNLFTHQDTVRNKEDDRRAATTAVTEAINALNHWQAEATGAQKLNQFHFLSPSTWLGNNEAKERSDIALSDAEGKRKAAIIALQNAGMAVPTWLSQPIGPNTPASIPGVTEIK